MPPFADAPRVPVTERVSPHALDMESRGAEGVLEALAAAVAADGEAVDPFQDLLFAEENGFEVFVHGGRTVLKMAVG